MNAVPARARELRYDWIADAYYEPRPVPVPPSRVAQFEHVCPDGTAVSVSARYISMTDATLLCWVIGGARGMPTSVVGWLAGEPDWSIVDAAHATRAP